MREYASSAYKGKGLVLSAVCLIFGLQSGSAIAYPQVEMQSCIANAVNATMVKGLKTTYKSIEKYCDCALRRILDEGREVKKSLDYCNARYIN